MPVEIHGKACKTKKKIYITYFLELLITHNDLVQGNYKLFNMKKYPHLSQEVFMKYIPIY